MDATDDPPDGRLSRAAAGRLSQYLRALGPAGLPDAAGGTVSSDALAGAVRVSAAQVRRDLAALGHLGQRGVGYDAAGLAAAIRHTLGIDRPWRAVLIGVGNLARALLKSQAFTGSRFAVVALFDADPAKVGTIVDGLLVEPVTAIAARVPAVAAELGVLTVPAGPAQRLADALATAGIKGLMNFAPVNLRRPPGVEIVTVDLAVQLEQLAFLVRLAATGETPADRG